ncbi:MAG: T9SS type A sorting domain-containing protein [Pseudomonadota bacterium]
MKHFLRSTLALICIAIFSTFSYAQEKVPDVPARNEIFQHISEYANLNIIEEIPEMDKYLPLPEGVKETYYNLDPVYPIDESREVTTTTTVFHDFRYRNGSFSSDQGVTFSPALYGSWSYSHQWQPTTITFPQPANSVTINTYGYYYGWYYGGELIAYDENGDYLGYAYANYWYWGSITYNAPAGTKIGSIVMQNIQNPNGYTWYTQYMWVTYDNNEPPVAIAQNVTTNTVSNCEADVIAAQIDNGSYDPDGDPLTYSVSPTGPYPLGNTNVTFTVSDGELSSSASAVITIIDNTAPIISPVSNPITLWPPNHKYHTVNVSECFTSISDNCTSLSNSDVIIVKVTSDEAEDANGGGDGNTTDDMVIASDCKSVDLRKERKGNGNGRVYTIHMEIEDGNGNTGTATYQVHVPKSKNGTAVDDGAVYEVIGNCGAKSAVAFEDDEIVDKVSMKAYPNPTSTSATVEFTLSESNNTTVTVYNTMGLKVATLFEGIAESGQIYRIKFDGSNLAKGLYYIRLQSGNSINEINKLILTR